MHSNARLPGRPLAGYLYAVESGNDLLFKDGASGAEQSTSKQPRNPGIRVVTRPSEEES